MMRYLRTYPMEHHNHNILLYCLISSRSLALSSSHPRFARSSLSHSSRWSCWGRAWARWRILGLDAAPGASERSEGGDTTALFPTLSRGGAVPDRVADDVSDFDGYHIVGTPPGGRDRAGAATAGAATAARGRGGTSCRGTSTASRRTTTAAASPWRGVLSGVAKRGEYGDLPRHLDELVERNHEGRGGSASLLEKDPRVINLGSEGDIS